MILVAALGIAFIVFGAIRVRTIDLEIRAEREFDSEVVIAQAAMAVCIAIGALCELWAFRGL